MLHKSTKLRGLHVLATDGEVGHVDDVLVDERSWTVRYLVVDTSRDPSHHLDHVRPVNHGGDERPIGCTNKTCAAEDGDSMISMPSAINASPVAVPSDPVSAETT